MQLRLPGREPPQMTDSFRICIRRLSGSSLRIKTAAEKALEQQGLSFFYSYRSAGFGALWFSAAAQAAESPVREKRPPQLLPGISCAMMLAKLVTGMVCSSTRPGPVTTVLKRPSPPITTFLIPLICWISMVTVASIIAR